MAWISDLRITLLVSLAILLIVIVWRRFKQRTVAHELPVRAHAELITLQMRYHPPRLRVEVIMPDAERIRPAMLDLHHGPVHHWPEIDLAAGSHILEFPLNGHTVGDHYFELATGSQRTVRKFSVIPG